MYLQGKDYVEAAKPSTTVPDEVKNAVKADIKIFCPADKKKSYEEIIKYIQNKYSKDQKYFTNDFLIMLIEDLKAKDKDYELPAVEIPFEPK